MQHGFKGKISRHLSDDISALFNVLVYRAFKVDIQLYIHVSYVFYIGPHTIDAIDYLIFLGGDVILQKEKCLFPMGIWRIGRC